ncbi:hypothetical protein [Vibrio owensii]|uniref:hypothetical protein n=1 Tax=Vibrio owensii TaxID=696485 RepID=UPI0040697FE0
MSKKHTPSKLAKARSEYHKARSAANKWEKRAKSAERLLRLLNPDFTFKIVEGQIKIKDLPEGYGEAINDS